jgi:nitroreductase
MCERACPSGVFAFDGGHKPVVRYAGRCISCGHCVAICPHGAFAHSGLLPEKFSALPEQDTTFEALASTFAKRRSCRLFATEAIEKHTLEKLIDATRHAPTSTNAQNVKHLVLTSQADIDTLAQATARYYLRLMRQLENPITRTAIAAVVGKRIVEAYRYRMPAIVEMFEKQTAGQDPLFRGATAVLVLYAPGMPHIASASCNLAAGQLLLLAPPLGLGAFYNGYALTALVRDKSARNALHIPASCTPGAVIALGKQAAVFHRLPPRNARRIIWGLS